MWLNRTVFAFLVAICVLGVSAWPPRPRPRPDGYGRRTRTTRTAPTAAPTTTTNKPAPGPDDNTDTAGDYKIVDTGVTTCTGADSPRPIKCPSPGEPLYGQDASYSGNQFSYVDNGDGTITDSVTGLMWQQDPGTRTTLDAAKAAVGSFSLAGHDDWRVANIKELYSLINFNGRSGRTLETCTPYIDTEYFKFTYGEGGTATGSRLIDAQCVTSTEYVSTTMYGAPTMFGVNFADGRIKGYPKSPRHCTECFWNYYVRGNPNYGKNNFVDNGDDTITDKATGLMWLQQDSGHLGAGKEGGLDWEEALGWAEGLEFAGHSDWRVPSIKELHSIIDYSRSPDTTASPAIDPIFQSTSIVNEGGNTDWPYVWSGTTHKEGPGGIAAAYVSFGRALGYMNGVLLDVHGAGAQRSDPKSGDPADWAGGHGPQGDVIRIYNFVRPVRDA